MYVQYWANAAGVGPVLNRHLSGIAHRSDDVFFAQTAGEASGDITGNCTSDAILVPPLPPS